MSSKIHSFIEEGNNVWVECLPVRVFKVVFLRLKNNLAPADKYRRWNTYTFIFESLYNRECSWVVNILHHNPVDGLLVLAVNAGSFNQLCLEAGNGIGLVVSIEVDCECIDHFENFE